jgi:GNAT superfamily N-acetyltransferase
MGRPQVVLREAVPADADFLAGLWSSSLRRVEPEAQVADVLTVIERAHEAPEQRLVVAEYDDRPAGAVLLHLGTVSSLNLEPTVRVLSPSVVPELRRHGVGHALLEAALCFADEHGVSSLGTAVSPGARESNRFMARLGFSALATYRIAPAAVVRARLRGQRPAPVVVGANGRAATRIIAARRSMRRSRAAG